MPNAAFSRLAVLCLRGACKPLASLLVASTAIAFIFTAPVSRAQNSKNPAMLPAPSEGKAIVCIYRNGRFTGSAAHDEIFVNDTHLGRLLNGEYMFQEVPAGTVVIIGLPKMYYAGGAVMSSYTAISNAARKENERARFEAEAGKTYYFKWTSEPFATGIKVTPQDPSVGAKEMSKLHLSKPPDDTNTAPTEAKDSARPAPQ